MSDRNHPDRRDVASSDDCVRSASRRGFLSGAVATVAGVVGGCKSDGPAGPRGQLLPPEAFPRRKLGRDGPLVPILQQGGDYYYSPRLVKQCMVAGVRSFDTAEQYTHGKAEGYVGTSMAKLKIPRADYFLSTKGRPKRPGDILGKHIPASLRRLRTDYVDLWYIHDLDDTEVLASKEWRDAAAAAKQSGKTRLIGVTCHNGRLVEVMTAAARCGWVDAMMIRYNYRSYGDEALERAIDACYQAGVGLIAMKTQASAVSFARRVDPFREQGYNRHQAVLRAVWQDRRITAAVSAMPSVRIVQQNAAAAFEPLSDVEARLLRHDARATSQFYCPGGCGGCRRECERAVRSPLAVADILRFCMYHDSYGRRPDARRMFADLPPERRRLDATDLIAAERACPNDLALTTLLPHAVGKLS